MQKNGLKSASKYGEKKKTYPLFDPPHLLFHVSIFYNNNVHRQTPPPYLLNVDKCHVFFWDLSLSAKC